MGPDPLQSVLDGIATRRPVVTDLASELRKRVDELGQIPLDSKERQLAFAEVLAAITPPGFEIFPLPDDCAIDPGDHSITLAGAVVDRRQGQVVGIIKRTLRLDAASVDHEFFRLQRPYRGGGLATLLLKRSFDFYETIGIQNVRINAALETGRWYWARLGFDFADLGARGFVAAWGTVALLALGESPLPPDAPARRWAQLGSGEPAVLVSLNELHAALETHVQTQLADPATKGQFDGLGRAFSDLFGVDWLSRDRFVAAAEANGFDVADRVPIGRAIMLTGPDWNGVFDLTDAGARTAFEEELSRALKRSTTGL